MEAQVEACQDAVAWLGENVTAVGYFLRTYCPSRAYGIALLLAFPLFGLSGAPCWNVAIDILVKGSLFGRRTGVGFWSFRNSPSPPRVHRIEEGRVRRATFGTIQKVALTTSGFRLSALLAASKIHWARPNTHATESGLMKSENASPILRLPLETLEVFIGLASVSSQLSLACVSQLFHSLTLRWLYRDIALYSPGVVVACCRTLAANPMAATSVRSLLITYS